MSEILNFFLKNYPLAIFEVFWKYILPVVILFSLFTLSKGFIWKNNRIQKRLPKQKFILHEIKWWGVSMFIASLVTLLGSFLITKNYNLVYDNISDFGLPYLFISFIILLFIHDTYFYWIHKFIHSRKVYRRIHSLHHRSPTPTPFDGFAVTPYEALAEFLFLPLISFVLPIHTSMYIIFGGFYVFYNAYLHLGYEVLPKSWVNLPVLKYINTAVHHDQHHTTIKYNFGLYFNIWDRLMGTLHPDYNKLYADTKSGLNSGASL